MLVLTRRKNQKVLFPNLGIAVEVIGVSGKSVRLGVDAPRDVRIVREELEHFDAAGVPGVTLDDLSAETARRQLDTANLALHLARNLLQQGLDRLAEDALVQALECLKSLDHLLDPAAPDIVSRPQLAALEQASTVRESGSVYESATRPATATALVLGGSPAQRKRLIDDPGTRGNLQFAETSPGFQIEPRPCAACL